MKHRLKLLLRALYSRVLFHTGLWRLVDRAMPRRLTILAGHCVDDPQVNAELPADMKIRPQRLERVLGYLARRYQACTVGEGFRRLCEGPGRSLVALSMDDGYRDNHRALLPLLARAGGRATVFLETRALDERRLNWSHKWFWLLARSGPEALVRSYVAASGDAPACAKLRALLGGGSELAYAAKRALKYDADPADRERTLDGLFARAGGDERALCERLYLGWDEARELHAAGVELGGHTCTHAILSRLEPAAARAEVEGSRRALAREIGAEPSTFAYPFGRRWDFDDAAARAVRESGFEVAVTTHAGTNLAGSDPLRLARCMLDDATPLHLLATEACGGFELLRRLGIDLSE